MEYIKSKFNIDNLKEIKLLSVNSIGITNMICDKLIFECIDNEIKCREV